MRILQVSYTYPPFLEMGGPPVKVKAIAEGLAGRGHEVTVLTADHGRPSRTHVRNSGGVEAVYLRTAGRYRSVPVTPGVFAFCRRRLSEFDVVHLYGLYDLTGPIVASRARRRGVPYVLEPMGMYRPLVRSFAKKRLYHLLFGRRLAGGASRIVATSEQERAELIGDGLDGGVVKVRRNGIDLRAFEQLPPRGRFRSKWGIDPAEPITLYLGRLATKKHPELALAAFARLPEPRGRLVFVGPDEDGYGRRLGDEASRLGVREGLVFSGPLWDEEKAEALVDADVFVLPSENENFGNSVGEAMACGTPAIITDRCGIAPYVRDRCGLVVPLDEDRLAEALARLIGDDELRARFAAEGPVVARGLSWDEPVEQTKAMYAELVELQGARRSA